MTSKAQRYRWNRLAELGCIASKDGYPCGAPASIHHCGTGMGGRKDDDKVIPLCHHHHQGAQGIHTLSRRAWQEMFGTEQELMERAGK